MGGNSRRRKPSERQAPWVILDRCDEWLSHTRTIRFAWTGTSAATVFRKAMVFFELVVLLTWKKDLKQT